MAKKKAVKKKTTKKKASKKKASKKTTQKTTKKTSKKKVTKKAAGKKKTSKKVSAKKSSGAQMEGKKVPSGKYPVTGGSSLNLADLKKAVVYFYPKDNTSGCTLEGQDFTAQYKKFKSKGYEIYGVSPDSLKSHDKFKDKYKFPFELISDEDKKLCEKFGVWVEKSMYGRKYMGVERSTFLIKGGKIAKEWRKVRVKGHVADVLESLDS